MVVRTEKSVGLLRERLPMASVLVVRPGQRFRLSRFKGNYIIRDLTRLIAFVAGCKPKSACDKSTYWAPRGQVSGAERHGSTVIPK